MSVKCIDLIIRQHTGANASDTVKITHEEVMAMIHCAGEPSKISVGDRAELMAALEMFGGNEIHPDIFSSPEDKAALAKTAMEGIETAEKFSTLTPGSQAAFIWKCLIVGSGNTVGFTRVLGNVTDLPADLQKRVARFFEIEQEKAGPKYEDNPFSSTTIYKRKSQAYGYAISASWSRENNSGTWEAEAYYGPSGELLKSTGGFEPPDSD
jgi:hypothetical protein